MIKGYSQSGWLEVNEKTHKFIYGNYVGRCIAGKIVKGAIVAKGTKEEIRDIRNIFYNRDIQINVIDLKG